jgi:GTP cyclohydrolase-4
MNSKRDPMTTTRFALDVQSLRPAVHVALSRVGVENVEKVIRVGPPGAEVPYLASFRTEVDLGPAQKGAHMSRFEEVVNEVIGDLVVGDGARGALRAEDVARRVAVAIRDRQDARRAEVHVTARYPEERAAPVSDIRTQEIFTLHGIAVATDTETRTITGVTAQGMTACPCAQEHLRESSAERLSDAGFDEQQIATILEAVPVATHNQRGLGTVYLGRIDGPANDRPVDVDALDLVRLVESSMSSEIFELMKRSDEGTVVERAHRNPRFVEDCVREMIRQIAEQYGGLPDDAFFLARQQNLETIHQHDVIAERFGTLGELRRELTLAEEPAQQTSLREWLDGAAR